MLILIPTLSITTQAEDIWSQIRTSALAPNSGINGRALPLAGTWENGWYKYKWGDNRGGTMFEPNYVIELIEKQHRLLVNIELLAPHDAVSYYGDYMEGALNYLEQKNQPIVVKGTQYEQNLYLKEPYISLTPTASPRVYTTSQQLLNMLTPFPPDLSKWYDVGEDWVEGNPAMDALQNVYPAPEKIIFLGNNEAQKLEWHEAETSRRYVELYGTGQNDNFKRQKFAEGWRNCYEQLFAGMRTGLNEDWDNNIRFVGYKNGGREFFGYANGWVEKSLHYNGEMAWEQHVWDGASMPYYLPSDGGENHHTDFTVFGQQVMAQNCVFMLEDRLAEYPEFWHEMSVSIGGASYHDWVINTLGQTFNADRYKGNVQFGMWLLTPRLVRHFNKWAVDRETEGLEYFDAVMDAVDRVHTDPLLKKFWKYGELVQNSSRTHPYQSAIPPEFSGRQRWFQLNTNLDPATPWALATEIPVFAIARVIGTTPSREWLVYAHSPLQNRTDVQLTLPGYGAVTTDVSREGTFVHVRENDNDLMAYYSLNDTAQDLSGNGNNGTLVNSPSYVAAKTNKGISLNKVSSQYVNCGRSAALSASREELTVSAWVNANALAINSSDWILAKGSIYGSPKNGFSLRCWNGTLYFNLVGPNDTMISVTGPTLTIGSWYHISGVFKGGQYLKLYVNGEEFSKTTNIPATMAATPNYDLHIGAGSYCGYHWNGIIDEVKIFNRALSEEEVTDEACRLIHLDFERITSGTVLDISRNGNHGTLVNNSTLTRTRVAGNNAIQLQRSTSKYVNAGRDSTLDGSDELTIDVWAKADTLQANSIDWILAKGILNGSSKSGYSLRCYHKKLAFMVGGPGSYQAAVVGPTLQENVWYHIICVFKGGEYMKLIVNGDEYVSTSGIPASIVPSPDYDLEIGAGSYCGYYWDGIIDEVKIYNKALQ